MKISRKSLTIMALLLVIVSVTALFAGCQSSDPTTASTPLIPSTSPDPTEVEPTVEPTTDLITKPLPETTIEPTIDPTKPEEEDVWGVCGSFTNWGNAGDGYREDYILVLDPETGLLTTEEPLELSAGDEFKVRKNGVWGEEYPAQNFVVTYDGLYYITFDPETHEVQLIGLEVPPSIEPAEFTDAQKGTYICKNDAWSMDCTLTIHDDSTITLADSLQGWSASKVNAFSGGEDNYYFEYSVDGASEAQSAQFRFVNGLVYLYLTDGDFYMIKPTEGLGFSGAQVGTFAGKDDAGDVDYSLTVHENGTVSYAYSISVSGYGFTISASDEDLAVSEYEGKYYFLYEDAQSGAVLAAFRFNDDGSVSLEDTFDEEGEPLNTATLQVAEEEVTWGVCGSFTNWGNEGDTYREDYILVLDPETGLFTTEEALELNAGDEFKVRKNGVWGEEYPAQNYVVEKGGKYFITFDAETHEVALVAVEDPAEGFTAEQIGKYEASSWNTTDKRTIVVKENGTITYKGSEELTVTYENGAYHFTYNGIAYSFTFTTQLSETGYLHVGIVLDISNEPDLEADADKTVTIWKVRGVA